MRKPLAALALALATVANAQPAKPALDPTIGKIAAEFVTAFNGKDPARVAALFADDAVLMPPNQPAVRGRANIEAWFKQGFAAGVTGMALTPTEQRISGGTGYDVGQYSLSVPTPAGPATVKGKYLVLFKKVGGQWKVAYDIDNTDAAPAPKP